ncbi:hypothetical protein AGABI2DRAFT_178338, partial [Agaricus bisporus var. bisporus H97]|uniref:hypothetical protein n=1 Tax=Agaricus bisporus var. bisporus (strain H97 / ATCC MYA-4626 / FGSC 10389) TaxID=936046 RepID=UPI00029F7902
HRHPRPQHKKHHHSRRQCFPQPPLYRSICQCHPPVPPRRSHSRRRPVRARPLLACPTSEELNAGEGSRENKLPWCYSSPQASFSPRRYVTTGCRSGNLC